MYRIVRRPSEQFENNTNKLFKNKEKRFTANSYYSMTCLHDHDKILEFQRKYFERFSHLPKLSLCLTAELQKQL